MAESQHGHTASDFDLRFLDCFIGSPINFFFDLKIKVIGLIGDNYTVIRAHSLSVSYETRT